MIRRLRFGIVAVVSSLLLTACIFDEFDIVENAEEKMGFEFSTEFRHYVGNYFDYDKWINWYLSEDELYQLAREFDSEHLLLNVDKILDIKAELIDMVGTEDPYVYGGNVHISANKFFLDIVNPNNPTQVDQYTWNYDRWFYNPGRWTVEPVKLDQDEDPMDDAYPLSEIKFETIETLVGYSNYIVQENGEWREFDNMGSVVGMSSVMTMVHPITGEIIYSVTVHGVRSDQSFYYDQNGQPTDW
ncbi:MAG: hypothetical protein GX483_06240 [Actinomycetaceae bacterium]|nr:hypothetical protein [Actinomycetaceae bacterium]